MLIGGPRPSRCLASAGSHVAADGGTLGKPIMLRFAFVLIFCLLRPSFALAEAQESCCPISASAA